MVSRFDVMVAAPPDDGGHQGSFTTPDQVMQVHGADRPEVEPPLIADANRYEGAAGASPLLMLLAALAFVAITAGFVFAYAWPF
ncbi:MAG TPA: hypothetical protein VNN80_20530 [Polyangiaceae bacterium]|nr:hypothetical protein [Polyangiaceae bacterium]